MKKILSDGTTAKELMIVVVIDGSVTNGNDTGTITQIVEKRKHDERGVKCVYVRGDNSYGSGFMTEYIDCLRKATTEEELIFKSYGK